MDHRRENRSSSEDVVNVLSLSSRNGMSESWGNGYVDQAVWATEDEYRMWNQEPSSEQPSKRSRSSNSDVGASSNRSRAIGKMFYKTKMCCKFRAGTCPYVTNCNFAHSVEELRKTPENWQETVAAHEEEPREEFQIPIAGADVGVGVGNEMQRSSKGRHCKKFYTEEGCPYGESCTFLHDEHSRARESVAISLGPGGGIGGSGGGSILKPSNWKTRICNKWELTGFCPFGSKCLFAHGAAEMNHYGGGPMDLEVKDSSILDSKQGFYSLVGSASLSEGYHMGIPSQRLCNVVQRSGLRLQKWKGPDKISKIYGDWIDDLE